MLWPTGRSQAEDDAGASARSGRGTSAARLNQTAANGPRIPTTQGCCEDQGGVWDPKKGCASKPCLTDDGSYHHGDKITLVTGDYGGYVKVRKTTTYKCNGFTGQWEQIA